jgi:hypothetical protein
MQWSVQYIIGRTPIANQPFVEIAEHASVTRLLYPPSVLRSDPAYCSLAADSEGDQSSKLINLHRDKAKPCTHRIKSVQCEGKGAAGGSPNSDEKSTDAKDEKVTKSA